MYIRSFLQCLFVLCWMLALYPQHSHSIIVPRPLGGERRIKLINYMPNSVIKFTGHYLYQSIIEFGNDEEIETITMGTSGGWQMHPAGNRIFLKPINNDAMTNMTVITNKRMYFFEMHAEEASGISDEDLAFMTKFVYPESLESHVKNYDADDAPDLSQPNLYNFRYTISGPPSEIEPIMIFDDGEFTYFKFREVNGELPAFFLVDFQGNESIINYRVANDYLIVERVSGKFTLRSGHKVLCVFNESYDHLKGRNFER